MTERRVFINFRKDGREEPIHASWYPTDQETQQNLGDELELIASRSFTIVRTTDGESEVSGETKKGDKLPQTKDHKGILFSEGDLPVTISLKKPGAEKSKAAGRIQKKN